MEIILSYITDFYTGFILFFSVSLTLFYSLFGVLSKLEIVKYKRTNSFVDYEDILASSMAPSISIIAPAYNEGVTIVDNVRSLLGLTYVNYEIVIVNDGSTDNSLEKLIKTYALEKVDYAFDHQIPTEDVVGIYKSTDLTFKRLIVVDKVNGGKSDALNAGINICNFELFCAVDCDCIIEPDALLKVVKPFLESEKRVIAAGGAIRISNSCKVEYGTITEVRLPKSFLARYQTLEYIRAFLLGRMAWSKLDGLLLISGAFGLFEKRIVQEIGGYDKNTVTEDLEIVLRMRRYMLNHKLEYAVKYIPDPLCWTECPTDIASLKTQRSRWYRGLTDTLWIHRGMFLNPKYKILGWLSYPFWLIYEYGAPIIEITGYFFFGYFLLFQQVEWLFVVLLLVAVFFFSLMLSTLSLFLEETSYNQYKNPKDFFKLLLVAAIEPLGLHQMMAWFSFRANLDLITGNKDDSWGVLQRTGFENEEGEKEEDSFVPLVAHKEEPMSTTNNL